MARPATLAKTARPSLSGVLPRERLFAALDRRRRASVVWVSGPPGCGKTTLVAGYIESRKSDSRWYQLDAGDSDVATFFYYMGEAWEQGSGKALAPLPLFTAEYHADVSAFARSYFQALIARLDTPFVLVLDNYQEIAAHSVFHDIVPVIAAEMPPDGCLIVLSRGDPPASLVRLRANRDMEALAWGELRLTRRESDAIVALWDAEFSDHALEQLHEKADGWAAGLILLLDQVCASGLTPALPDMSAPQLVFDYLAGEVFERFEPDTQSLLLHTAFLPEMTADMAVAVTGQPSAARRLEALHRSHHLVTVKPRGGERIYQYHPLLQEFLSTRAAEVLPAADCARLRRRSSELLEAEGDVDGALALLRQNGDWEGVTRLVHAHAAEMLRHGRAETLEQWLEELPEALLEEAPWLLYWLAACRFLSTPRESRLLYERAFAGFSERTPHDRKGLFLTCSGAMDAIIHELDDFTLFDRWITDAEALLAEDEDIPWPEVKARFTTSLFIAVVFRQPQHPRIVAWAEQAFTESQRIDDANARMTAQLLLAINLNYTGQFSRVRAFVDNMRGLCRSPHVSPLALTVLKDIESMFYMLTSDHERCLAAVYDGLEIARAGGVRTWNYHLLSNGVAGALGAGDLDTGADLLAQMRAQPEGARRLDLCNFHYYSAWLAMLRDDVSTAFQEQKTALRLATECGCPYYVAICRLAFAQVLIECGDQRRATAQLSQVRRIVRGIDNRLLEFTCLLGFAHIALTCGRERSALNSLRYALGLGKEHGFTHFVWWLPKAMAALCEYALEHDIETDYVRRLVRERGLMPAAPPVQVKRWPWPLRIYTFGEFRVLRDDQPLGMLAKLKHKPVELLKVLVGLGGENVGEAAVAEALWPRKDAEYAHKSLTTTLHRLRKLLAEDGAIRLQHGRLSLDPYRCWLDVRALESVLADIDDALQRDVRGASAEAVEGLTDRLLERYRGPFMAGERDKPWCLAQRTHLRNRFLRYIGELARYWEETDSWERAIEIYRRALEADPLAEGFYRRLMIAHREIGRHAEAVDVYERCRTTFHAELEAAPSPETTAIYERIVAGL